MARTDQKYARVMIVRWPPFMLGYGLTPLDPMYGLWEPVLDRFLLVSADSDLLGQLSLLASRRYRTSVIRLHSITGQPNVIDNSVCLNWTLRDSSDLSASDHNLGIVSDRGLCAAKPSDWPVEQEQQYLMAGFHLLRCVDGAHGLRFFTGIGFGYWHQYYELVKTVIDDPALFGADWELRYQFAKRTRQLVFRCEDRRELATRWQDLLTEFDLLQDWHTWVDQHG